MGKPKRQQEQASPMPVATFFCAVGIYEISRYRPVKIYAYHVFIH